MNAITINKYMIIAVLDAYHGGAIEILNFRTGE